MIRLIGPAIGAWLTLTTLAVAQPAETVDIDALMTTGTLEDKTLGDPGAPVTIVEYASMTCPHCRSFHVNTFEALKAKYIDTGDVYFVFREFPLDPLAFAAIMLARCAPQENFFPVVMALFAQQDDWAFGGDPEPALGAIHAPMGLPSSDFEACLSNDELFEGITWVADRATTEFGVGGTPTFFFNGRRVGGDMTIEQVDRLLAPMLTE